MSIGVVVADSKTLNKVDSKYYIITPEYKTGGMYNAQLSIGEEGACIAGRGQALKEIRQWLDIYHVQTLFAYNASFDKKHLPEFSKYAWYDIALISDKNIAVEEQQSNMKSSKVIEPPLNNVKSSQITKNESKKKRGILSWILGERSSGQVE